MYRRQFHLLMNRVKDQFQAVGNADLVVNCAQVVLNCLLGDGEVGTNLAVAVTEPTPSGCHRLAPS